MISEGFWSRFIKLSMREASQQTKCTAAEKGVNIERLQTPILAPFWHLPWRDFYSRSVKITAWRDSVCSALLLFVVLVVHALFGMIRSYLAVRSDVKGTSHNSATFKLRSIEE